jgi:hypothetical protein
MAFRYRREWRIPLGVDALWAALEDTSQYPRWWPWMHDAVLPPLSTGAIAMFSVAPPLPYHLDIRLELCEVVAGRRIETEVAGDLVGRASLDLCPLGPADSSVRLQWELELAPRSLRALSLFARPLLEWGHEMVVRSAVRQFATTHRLDPDAIVEIPMPSRRPPRPTPRRILRDGLTSGAVAGLFSGAPSTLIAAARRRPLLGPTRAAGTLFGAPTLPRAVVAHTVVSLGWGVVLSTLLPRRAGALGGALGGALAGAGIAALDLGLLAPRRFPAIAALEPGPQLADHLLFGAIVGALLADPAE